MSASFLFFPFDIDRLERGYVDKSGISSGKEVKSEKRAIRRQPTLYLKLGSDSVQEDPPDRLSEYPMTEEYDHFEILLLRFFSKTEKKKEYKRRCWYGPPKQEYDG